MKLLYIGTFSFFEENGLFYGLTSSADSFFEKYLDVFSSIDIIGCPITSVLNKSYFVKIEDNRIRIKIVDSNAKPQNCMKDGLNRTILYEEIRKADAILIKPSTRRGIMAMRIAKKLNKPFMIEMTGDIHNALLQHPDWKHRLYAPILYRQIKKEIEYCHFGLYVSRDYLQSRYPIKGEMCGCSDVILEPAEPAILEHRIAMIDALQSKDRVDIALIGFYQGLMKGVDTAIRALSQLPEKFHLNILGNGTEENRQKWIAYGEGRGVHGRIHFPQPLSSSHDVLQWLDTQDFFVLPTLSEGFGRCVAEAMSRGCVCFCTDICTMPELLPKECLFPKKDDVSLASMIKDAYDNPAKMKELARINFEHAKDYDFELLRERRNAFLQRFKSYCEQMKRN